jgi:hypothetical protein
VNLAYMLQNSREIVSLLPCDNVHTQALVCSKLVHCTYVLHMPVTEGNVDALIQYYLLSCYRRCCACKRNSQVAALLTH